MTSRTSFPGGLRAQLLIGLTVLFVGAGALAAIVVENVLTRRLLETRSSQLRSVALLVEKSSPDQVDRLVGAGLAEVVVVEGRVHGRQEAAQKLSALAVGESRIISADGVNYVGLAVRTDATVVRLAGPTLDIGEQVAKARLTLVLFGLLGAIFILAFAYGFFGLLVLRPVRAIGVATERAAQGDLASPIGLIPGNEFGRVAQSFNEMLERLDRSRRELESKVDELQLANRQLEETRDTLVRSEKLASIGQLAAGIAHEIGNPLAALSGYNELLQEGELDPADAEDILRRSSEQLERIRQVIRNLLDFSRDESDTPPRPTDLEKCVGETESLVGALPAARNVEFRVGELEGPSLWAVPSHLVQVLVNLTMNAVDALQPDGGVIRIERNDADEFVDVVIEDDGPGIPAAVVSRIFDPFFTTKAPGDGTGLGLAISVRIVQSLDGDIRLEEGEAGGARFVVRLPRADAAEPARDVPPGEDS